MSDEKVEFEDVTAIHESDLAVCVEIDGKAVWLPQAAIDDDSEVWRKGHTGTLVISRYWAEKKGLV